MLPLSLLTTAQGHPMLVELKSGETFNGHLLQCDNYMNLTLREVIQTNRDGNKFHRLAEVYIRGNNIKYLRIPDDVVDKVRERERSEYQQRQREQRTHGAGGTGASGSMASNVRDGRGRGRGRDGNSSRGNRGRGGRGAF
ncbi:hypothetical protein PYCC9005_002468 [Savitreella phatthalungensis]